MKLTPAFSFKVHWLSFWLWVFFSLSFCTNKKASQTVFLTWYVAVCVCVSVLSYLVPMSDKGLTYVREKKLSSYWLELVWRIRYEKHTSICYATKWINPSGWMVFIRTNLYWIYTNYWDRRILLLTRGISLYKWFFVGERRTGHPLCVTWIKPHRLIILKRCCRWHSSLLLFWILLSLSFHIFYFTWNFFFYLCCPSN